MNRSRSIILLRNIKENGFTLLWVILFAVLLISTRAKTILLGTILKTGLLKADTGQSRTPFPFPTRLTFLNSEGSSFQIERLRGKVVFLNFWANWCPPCLAEMATINSLYNKLKSDDHFYFIMADTDNDLIKSLAFMKSQGYNLPLYGFSGAIPPDLSNGSIPLTLIIDPEGRVIRRYEGIENYDSQEMLAFLSSLKR